MSNDSGTTVLELLVVLVVLAAVSALVASQLTKPVDSTSVTASWDELVQAARSNAIRSGQAATIDVLGGGASVDDVPVGLAIAETAAAGTNEAMPQRIVVYPDGSISVASSLSDSFGALAGPDRQLLQYTEKRATP